MDGLSRKQSEDIRQAASIINYIMFKLDPDGDCFEELLEISRELDDFIDDYEWVKLLQ